jgi:hypothetical protein
MRLLPRAGTGNALLRGDAEFRGTPVAVENVRIHVSPVRPNDRAELAIDSDLAEEFRIPELFEDGTPKLWLEVNVTSRSVGEREPHDVTVKGLDGHDADACWFAGHALGDPTHAVASRCPWADTRPDNETCSPACSQLVERAGIERAGTGHKIRILQGKCACNPALIIRRAVVRIHPGPSV